MKRSLPEQRLSDLQLLHHQRITQAEAEIQVTRLQTSWSNSETPDATWHHNATLNVHQEVTEHFSQAIDTVRHSEHSAVTARDSEIASLTFIAEQSHQQKAYYESELAVVTRDMRSEMNAPGDEF